MTDCWNELSHFLYSPNKLGSTFTNLVTPCAREIRFISHISKEIATSNSVRAKFNPRIENFKEITKLRREKESKKSCPMKKTVEDCSETRMHRSREKEERGRNPSILQIENPFPSE